MSLKKAKKRRNKKFTILFVPHDSEGKINSLKIHHWLIGGLACFGVFSLMVFSYLILSYFNMHSAVVENESLKKVNAVQSQEIEDLYEETDRALKRLEEIDEMDAKIRGIVGLEKQEANQETPSRSQGLRKTDRRVDSINKINNNNEKTILCLKENLAVLDEACNEKDKRLHMLEKDVKNRLAYLDALPDYWPLRGKITSDYGVRKNPFNKKRKSEFHAGIDIKGAYGTAIRSAGSGTVISKGYKRGYGNTVIISHGYGYTSQYAHCSKLLVNVGQKVKKGEIIARVGSSGRSTGPHLDFRISKNGEWINPKKILK